MTSEAIPLDDAGNDTVLKLSRITDPGKFEALATDVLRAAEPDLYGHLTQPGINAQGKTIKSPVDAISFVPGATPRHMVAAHHTTGDKNKLRAKWLSDPKAANSNKKSGREKIAVNVEGDLTKTVSIANDERKSDPALKVTLALTTNDEPSEDLTRDAERAASKHKITLDIWSGRKLAFYLDNDPLGQWIRRRHLGIKEERLSLELLRELSQQSLEENSPIVPKTERIEREDVQQLMQTLAHPMAFLLGESGFGKSIACLQHLTEHIAQGGCGLVISHEILERAHSLSDAVDIALHQLHRELVHDSGTVALSLCSSERPLLLVIEDVNKSAQPGQLIDRLVSWGARAASDRSDSAQSWHLICPTWPELVGALGDDACKRIAPLATRLGRYSRADATKALLSRAAREDVDLSPLEAESIADALDCDPLLIGLHDLRGDGSPADVIARFISHRAERLATEDGNFVGDEYRSALSLLAHSMMQNHEIQPAWSTIQSWFQSEPEALKALRELVKQAVIVRIPETDNSAKIAFRHDRVRKWLLAQSAHESILIGNLDDAILSEPFFADVLGQALADAPLEAIKRARQLNPLALFFALQSFREASTDAHHQVLAEIDHWLSEKSTHSRKHQSARYAALNVLSETRSSHVLPVLAQFRDRTWSEPLAGLRNGDLNSGIDLCYSLEPGSGALWRDLAVEHAKARFGPRLTQELSDLLKNADCSTGKIIGGLRLAGHFGDTSLASAIADCWRSDTKRMDHLDDHLWAAAQCGGERTDELLSPICDAWASLPSESEKEGHASPRDDLAAHHVAWAFWRKLPEPALRYFIARAENDDLRWPITYMLHGVDQPDAAEFIARELADRTRELEGTDRFCTFMITVRDHWSRWQRENKRRMSQESRERLRQLWSNEPNDKHLRRASFKLWAATTHPEDLALLRAPNFPVEFSDEALRARLKRGDKTAIPLLIDKLHDDEQGMWWQLGRQIWSDDLTAVMDEQLASRATVATRQWNEHLNGDWIKGELIMGLPGPTAEALLLKHWDHLRFCPYYVQAALYVSTIQLRDLVAATVSDCPEPRELFAHISMHFGIKTVGRPGITRKEQIEGLAPYVHHINEFDIFHFWEVCNERGWTDFRQKYLDDRLGKWREKTGLDDETLVKELDQKLSYDRVPWLHYWVDRHLEDGRTIDRILRIVRDWLGSNRSAKAIEIAASIVIHAGKRADIEILDEGNDGSILAGEIIDDARFSVRRRHLR